MIRKEDIRRAVAESVGINPNQLPEAQNRNGIYLFRSATTTLCVLVSKGVVRRVGRVPPGLRSLDLAADDGEYIPKILRHPYVGLGLTEAVLQHMEKHPASTSYERIAIEGA